LLQASLHIYFPQHSDCALLEIASDANACLIKKRGMIHKEQTTLTRSRECSSSHTAETTVYTKLYDKLILPNNASFQNLYCSVHKLFRLNLDSVHALLAILSANKEYNQGIHCCYNR